MTGANDIELNWSGSCVTAGAIKIEADWIGPDATIPELLILDISLLTFPPSALQSFGRYKPTINNINQTKTTATTKTVTENETVIRQGVSTFSCGEIGEKVDDIGAMVIAVRKTEVASETSI